MELVTFQPIRVPIGALLRPVMTEVLNGPDSIAILSAPRGFGKTVLAAQIFEQWAGDRLWINVSKWPRINNNFVPLLLAIAQQIAPEQSPKINSLVPMEIIQSIVVLLNNCPRPMLLVIDDLSAKTELPLLKSLTVIASLMSVEHKILVCTRRYLSGNLQMRLNTQMCRLVGADTLRFTPNEVHQLVANESKIAAVPRMVSECDGWPALVAIAVREYFYETQEQDIKRIFVSFVRESIAQYLPKRVYECAVALAEIEAFDDSLFHALDKTATINIQQMVKVGFINKTNRLKLSIQYRWSTFVHQALQDEIQHGKSNHFIALRMIAWADKKKCWAEALFLALKLDDAVQIRKRLIHTGPAIQELGHSQLLRRALNYVQYSQHLPLHEYMALLFIDLGAHSTESAEFLPSKISETYQFIRALPNHLKGHYLNWIKCVDAQHAMRHFNTPRAKQLLTDIESEIGFLPIVYQVKALSILGEIAIEEGRLQKALVYFQQGADLSEFDNLPSSFLWHRHQQAQVHTFAGQMSVAENIRFSAIQHARETEGKKLFTYHCLLRAHCENLLVELRVHEVEPYLVELEAHFLLKGDVESLPVNLIRLECHRLTCMVDSDYHKDVHNTVSAIECALMSVQHPHIVVRAQQSLLNFWVQSEQVHKIGQWYQRQSVMELQINGPNRLLHLRNLLYAYLVLRDFDYDVKPSWPEYSTNETLQWLVKWPGVAPGPLYLLMLSTKSEDPVYAIQQLSTAMGGFSQMNALSEPLSYLTRWLEPLQRSDINLQRYQTIFLSRLNAIRGNRVKHKIVRDGDIQSGSMVPIGLSPRELQLLQCVSKGETNETIAEHLNLSVGTIKNQLTKIYRKLGVTNRDAARSRYKSIAAIA